MSGGCRLGGSGGCETANTEWHKGATSAAAAGRHHGYMAKHVYSMYPGKCTVHDSPNLGLDVLYVLEQVATTH